MQTDLFSTVQDQEEPAKRAEALRRDLARYGHAYYVLDAPIVPDSEYDRLFAELQALEAAHPELVTPDSPTRRVGGTPLAQFEKVTHRVPMLSLQNGFSDADVAAFDRRIAEDLGIGKVESEAELQFDGLAVDVRY